MPADLDISESFFIGEIADLERIARGDQNLESAPVEFFDDRLEKRHVDRR